MSGRRPDNGIDVATVKTGCALVEVAADRDGGFNMPLYRRDCSCQSVQRQHTETGTASLRGVRFAVRTGTGHRGIRANNY